MKAHFKEKPDLKMEAIGCQAHSKSSRRFTALVGFVVVLFAFILPVSAQISAFTYQGRLNANDQPANGLYDFMFRLLNDPTNGIAVPIIPLSPGVFVTNGIFTTGVDFGAQNFGGSNLWLEISVRTNGGGVFATLSPRQLLASTPYAIQSLNASNLLGNISSTQVTGPLSVSQLPSLVITNGSSSVNLAGTFSGNGGGLTNLSASALPVNVALLNANQTLNGTNKFTQTVILSNGAPVLKIIGPGNTGATATLDLSTYDPGTNAPSARIQTTDNNWGSDWDFFGKSTGNNTNSLVSFLHISAGGNVGIGITNLTNATTRLQVNGNLQLGAGGTNYAISSQENLRIVRGIVNSDGTYTGSGFNIVHPNTGFYVVNFSPAFSSTPTLMVTPQTGPAFITTPLETGASEQIYTWDKNGVAADEYFSFLAIGSP